MRAGSIVAKEILKPTNQAFTLYNTFYSILACPLEYLIKFSTIYEEITISLSNTFTFLLVTYSEYQNRAINANEVKMRSIQNFQRLLNVVSNLLQNYS